MFRYGVKSILTKSWFLGRVLNDIHMLDIFLDANCLVYYHYPVGRGMNSDSVAPDSSSTTHNINTSLFGYLRLNYLNYISFFMNSFAGIEVLWYTNTKYSIKNVKQVDTYC